MKILESDIFDSSPVFAEAYLEDEDFNVAFNSHNLIDRSKAEQFFYYLSSSFSLQNYSTFCVYENDSPVAAINFGKNNPEKSCGKFSLAWIVWFLNGIRLRFSLDKHFLESFSKYSEMVFLQSSKDNYISISQLGVLKCHRRRGFASALIEIAIQYAQELDDFRGVQVATFSEHNCQIYKKLGFEEQAESSNNGITCWILTKEK